MGDEQNPGLESGAKTGADIPVRLVFWAGILVLCIAAAFGGYRIALWQIPRIAMTRAEASVSHGAQGWNRMVHQALPTSDARKIVRPSPDQFYSACAYDLSRGPVLISGTMPGRTYWSMSFFDHDTNVFFVENDRQRRTPAYRYLLLGPGMTAPAGVTADHVVRSPTRTGVVVQRVFVGSDADRERLDSERRTGRCTVLPG